ncbi:MAG: dienelactone hydrolase family protein [Acidimicrobiales bacterium]
MADLGNALSHLRALPEVGGAKVGVTGFCFGGLMTYLVAKNFDPDAAVSYYGSNIANLLDGVTERLTCPILFHFRRQQPVPAQQRRRQDREATASMPNVTVRRYWMGGHAFTTTPSRRSTSRTRRPRPEATPPPSSPSPQLSAMHFAVDEHPGLRPPGFKHSLYACLVTPAHRRLDDHHLRRQGAQPGEFGFFNLILGDPLCCMYCVNGAHAAGGPKDSLANVREVGEFVFNLCTAELGPQMNSPRPARRAMSTR